GDVVLGVGWGVVFGGGAGGGCADRLRDLRRGGGFLGRGDGPFPVRSDGVAVAHPDLRQGPRDARAGRPAAGRHSLRGVRVGSSPPSTPGGRNDVEAGRGDVPFTAPVNGYSASGPPGRDLSSMQTTGSAVRMKLDDCARACSTGLSSSRRQVSTPRFWRVSSRLSSRPATPARRLAIPAGVAPRRAIPRVPDRRRDVAR